MEENSTDNKTWPLLMKVPQKEITALVEGYLQYADKMKYLRYIIFGVVTVIACYNFFVAGKRFSIGELKMIQMGLAGILGLFVLALLFLGITLFTSLRKLNSALNHSADKYKVAKKPFRNEFHQLVKTTLGGPGLR